MSTIIAQCNLDYYNSFFEMMYNQYNSTVHIKLDENDKQNITYILNNINNSLKYNINIEETINLIEKIYPKQYIIGGKKRGKKMKGGSKVDIQIISAILSLILSICLIYQAYLEFNEMLTNLSLDKNDLKDAIISALDEVNASNEEITFLMYLFNSFNLFACNLATKRLIDAQFMIQDILKNTLTTSYETITNTCGTGMDIANWISPTTFNECISKTLVLVRDNEISKMQFNMNLIMTQIDKNKNDVYQLTFYGMRLGYGAIAYLTYRMTQKTIENKESSKINLINNDEEPLLVKYEDDMSDEENEQKGGKRMTKKRKNKKTKNKKTKSRKTKSRKTKSRKTK